MNLKRRISAVTVLTGLSVCAALPLNAQAAADADPWLRPAEVPHPADNMPNAEHESLGKSCSWIAGRLARSS